MSQQEEWRYIDWVRGIQSDKYQISNIGRLRDTYKNKIRAQSINSSGRYQVLLNNGPRKPFVQKMIQVARCVAMAFVPVGFPCDPNKLHIRHKDGNFLNNNADNLQWIMKHTNGVFLSLEDRYTILQIIKDHINEPVSKIAKLCSTTLNKSVSAQLILEWTATNPDGSMKSNIYDTLNVDPTPFKKERTVLKIPDEDVHLICQLLVEAKGDIRKVYELFPSQLKNIPQKTVQHILWKNTYTRISDEYFEYFGRGEFYPK